MKEKIAKRPLAEELRAYRARPLPEVGYVRLPSILAVFPVSGAGWREGVRRGIYPQPVKLGPRTVAWRVEDIRQLLATVGAEEEHA